MISVFLLAVIIFSGIWLLWSTITTVFEPPVTHSTSQIPLVIQSGESTQQIADDLLNKGLIRNALAFRAWARIKGLDTKLQVGAYNLTPDMTIDQIIARLLDGKPDEKRLLVVDGFRLEQIANQADAMNITYFSKKDFLNYTHHPDQFPDKGKYAILSKHLDMEGLLYPDTYLVPLNFTTVQLIDAMLDEFTQAVQTNNLVAQAQQHQLNEYEMVTLASIVQREASNTIDMPLVAGIYWNRVLKPNDETVGNLQSDPTVEYARDTINPPSQYWVTLDKSGTGDTVVPDSPWNTYTHKGWPPTPISSPNIFALRAAASPQKTDCYYFLSKPSNGRIVCAATYAQFQVLEQQYLK